MAWRDILVFADGSLNGLARLQIAAVLAGASADCRLTACAPIVLPQIPYGPMAAGLSDLVDRAHELAREVGGNAVRAIQQATPALIGERLSIESPEIELPDAARLAGVLGQCADLIVLGKPIAEDLSYLDDLLLEGALFRSGRPCLVVPRWEAPRSIATSVLIGWRGTAQAARAMHDALPFLLHAQSVRIFHAGDGAEHAGEGPLGLSRLAAHLRRHSVAVEDPRPAALRGEIGEALLDQAHTMGADLLVMGGYGHGRLREMILGGATRSILQRADIPILLAH